MCVRAGHGPAVGGLRNRRFGRASSAQHLLLGMGTAIQHGSGGRSAAMCRCSRRIHAETGGLRSPDLRPLSASQQLPRRASGRPREPEAFCLLFGADLGRSWLSQCSNFALINPCWTEGIMPKRLTVLSRSVRQARHSTRFARFRRASYLHAPCQPTPKSFRLICSALASDAFAVEIPPSMARRKISLAPDGSPAFRRKSAIQTRAWLSPAVTSCHRRVSAPATSPRFCRASASSRHPELPTSNGWFRS